MALVPKIFKMKKDFLPFKLSDDESLTHSEESIPSLEDVQGSHETLPLPQEQPADEVMIKNSNSAATINCVRNWLPRGDSFDELSPLLPVHSSPSSRPLSPSRSQETAPSAILDMVMWTAWEYVLTPSMRSYVLIHRGIFTLLAISILLGLGLWLYLDGHMGALLFYCNIIFCSLLRLVDPSNDTICS